MILRTPIGYLYWYVRMFIVLSNEPRLIHYAHWRETCS